MITNQNVLVLNSSYTPIYVTNITRAIKLLYRLKAEIISIENDSWIGYDLNSWAEASYFKSQLQKSNPDHYLNKGTDFVFGIPFVIRLTNFAKMPLKLKLTRANIFLRDDNICQYCGKYFTNNKLNIDHIIPKAQGGKNSWTNLVCSCIKCNTQKRDRTPKQAEMKLIRQPKRPSIFLLFKRYLRYIDKEPYSFWKPFFPDDVISEAYWNCEIIN